MNASIATSHSEQRGGSERTRWLWCGRDGCAQLEMETDSDRNIHRRGDASCSSLQQTTTLRNQSEQRFGSFMGNHLDSGLKGLLH